MINQTPPLLPASIAKFKILLEIDLSFNINAILKLHGTISLI